MCERCASCCFFPSCCKARTYAANSQNQPDRKPDEILAGVTSSTEDPKAVMKGSTLMVRAKAPPLVINSARNDVSSAATPSGRQSAISGTPTPMAQTAPAGVTPLALPQQYVSPALASATLQHSLNTGSGGPSAAPSASPSAGAAHRFSLGISMLSPTNDDVERATAADAFERETRRVKRESDPIPGAVLSRHPSFDA